MSTTAVTKEKDSIAEKASLLLSLHSGKECRSVLLQQSLRRYFALLDNLSSTKPVQWKTSQCNGKALQCTGIPQACSGKPLQCTGKINSVHWLRRHFFLVFRATV